MNSLNPFAGNTVTCFRLGDIWSCILVYGRWLTPKTKRTQINGSSKKTKHRKKNCSNAPLQCLFFNWLGKPNQGGRDCVELQRLMKEKWCKSNVILRVVISHLTLLSIWVVIKSYRAIFPWHTDELFEGKRLETKRRICSWRFLAWFWRRDVGRKSCSMAVGRRESCIVCCKCNCMG